MGKILMFACVNRNGILPFDQKILLSLLQLFHKILKTSITI